MNGKNNTPYFYLIVGLAFKTPSHPMPAQVINAMERQKTTGSVSEQRAMSSHLLLAILCIVVVLTARQVIKSKTVEIISRPNRTSNANGNNTKLQATEAQILRLWC